MNLIPESDIMSNAHISVRVRLARDLSRTGERKREREISSRTIFKRCICGRHCDNCVVIGGSLASHLHRSLGPKIWKIQRLLRQTGSRLDSGGGDDDDDEVAIMILIN